MPDLGALRHLIHYTSFAGKTLRVCSLDGASLFYSGYIFSHLISPSYFKQKPFGFDNLRKHAPNGKCVHTFLH
jgi:hypothetical protein